jgi:NitT/TauT family transport system substrate-binding protein
LVRTLEIVKSNRLLRIVVVLVVLAALIWLFWARPWINKSNVSSPPTSQKVVINEALRTVLYIPIYHAKERGYFKEAGLDVEIVTGGTATAAFSAMLNGEADFAVADPMYVPISQQKGSDTRVIAQIVARIAVWGVAKDGNIPANDSAALRGKRISTHQQPMTAYTYTVKTLRDAGLDPEKDVFLITGAPGSEFAAFSSGDAEVMFSLEPNTSRAILRGAKLIRSFPADLGDQVFTGLMTRGEILRGKRSVAEGIVRGIERALDDLQSNPDVALTSAKKFFPQIEDAVLKAAIKRLVDESVIPKSLVISKESWDKAVKVRLESGDLKRSFSLEESCDFSLASPR